MVKFEVTPGALLRLAGESAAARTGGRDLPEHKDKGPVTFIVLEGADGSGKTSLAKALASALRAEGREVTLTSEPWDRATLDHARGLSPRAAHLQFIADRARHVERVILPALARGEVVVCDRYALSGVVYALAADPELGARSAWRREGVDWRTGESALPRPDLTLVCDAGDKVLNGRIAGRASASEIDTDLALQARVRDLYHSSMWRIQPTDWRCRAVETSSTPEWSLEQALGFVREVL